MARRLPLIVHERIATWARHLRPRASAWPVRLIETRSADDLARALGGSACPIVVADLGRWPRQGLDDLGRNLPAAPDALVLVLDPGNQPGLPRLARELGASHVESGVVPPPRVVALIERWLPLARRRAEASGWTGEPEPTPEPWELPFLATAENRGLR